jgi:hypothetical protein
MASKNKDERAHVNALIKILQSKEPPFYVFIDRDAGAVRHTSSGFDFILAFDGCAVFCEAKEEKGKLSSWQQFVQAQITASGMKYCIIRFSKDGNFFSIDGKKDIAVKDATLQDFF